MGKGCLKRHNGVTIDLPPTFILLLNNSRGAASIIHGNNMTRATPVSSGERWRMNKWVNGWESGRTKWRREGGAVTDCWLSGFWVQFCCFQQLSDVSDKHHPVPVQLTGPSDVLVCCFTCAIADNLKPRTTEEFHTSHLTVSTMMNEPVKVAGDPRQSP